MLNHKKLVGVGLLVFGFALSAQAGPAMFQAAFIFHAWGNDVTSGEAYPYNEAGFTAAPLGHDCQSDDPYGPNGTPNPRYCSPAIIEAGSPVTGSGSLVLGGVTVGGTVGLPTSAFVTVGQTGFLATYYPYLQSFTYATITAQAGTFFPGGGPAADGTTTKTGMGQTTGDWVIRPRAGGVALGGVLGMLGRYGAIGKYVVTGKVGTYEGTSSWAIIPPMGINPYETIIGYTAMGKARWKNPYSKTETWVNNLNSNTSALVARGTGTRWTTGTAAVYVEAGVFQTILKRTGYDFTSMVPTAMGGASTTVRNIQLVTPVITHWIGPGFQTHTGQIGILKLSITPEPKALLLLAAGGGLLALLYWSRHRV